MVFGFDMKMLYKYDGETPLFDKPIYGVCDCKDCDWTRKEYAERADKGEIILIKVDEETCGAEWGDCFAQIEAIMKYQPVIVKLITDFSP